MGVFTGKVVIITGGASGIGRALGEELARRGARVILADVNAKLLEETAGSIAGAGYKTKAVTIDVTDFRAVKKMVDDTVTECGRLDYIFNNAGVVTLGEARDLSYDDWRKVIDTNLYGVVNGVVAAYPLMVKQGFGHIVNTASLAGLVPVTGIVPYVTSKYGVVGLSNALRSEGASLGVKVSAVCPGLIDTPIKYSKAVKIDQEKLLATTHKFLPAEKCAEEILRGVERNRAIIVVTGLAKVLWLLHRLSPTLMMRLIRRIHIKRLREVRIEE